MNHTTAAVLVSIMFMFLILFAIIAFIVGPDEPSPQELVNVEIPQTEIVEEVAVVEEDVKAKVKGKWVWARVTAYCPCSICCGSDANNVTSIGVKVNSGNPNDAYGIAADPKAVPYGTKIYVQGYWESLRKNKTFKPTEMIKVDDTGGAMRQSWREEGIIHLDVRYRTHKAARNWGRRWMRVFIYSE